IVFTQLANLLQQYFVSALGRGDRRAKMDQRCGCCLRRGRQFTAAASLDRPFIRVKSEEHPLRVGMRGEARVTVGSRASIEHAFEPIRQLRENLQP
ncbi:MAG TPA: hypothetical protein VIZ87_08230, partial [Terrimicrobium sp.]